MTRAYTANVTLNEVGPCCPALLHYTDVDVHPVVLPGKIK